mgnify:CR=1 FL=1
MSNTFAYQLVWKEKKPEYQKCKSHMESLIGSYEDFFEEQGWKDFSIKVIATEN